MAKGARTEKVDRGSEHIVLPIIALVFGVIGLVISWVPIINNAAFFFGLIGLILGIISLIVNRKNVKTISIIGTVIATAGMAIVLFTQYHYSNALDKATSELSSAVNTDDDSDSSATDKSKSDDSSSNKSMPTGEDTTLSSGNWEVGKDIKPGIYVLTAPSGSGNVDSDPKNYENPSINIILGSGEEDHETTKYRAYLNDGDQINISGLDTVNFETDKPLNNTSNDQYISGQYKVGTDIKPGRYKISAVSGSGNLITDGSVNEILSTEPDDGEVASTTVNLKNGEVLNSDVQMIQLEEQ